jgi:hypothetical protein
LRPPARLSLSGLGTSEDFTGRSGRSGICGAGLNVMAVRKRLPDLVEGHTPEVATTRRCRASVRLCHGGAIAKG